MLRTLLALTPVWVILGTYAIIDPFCVLYEYEDYTGKSNTHISPAMISTETFLRNKEFLNYDSFIVGSSLVIGTKTEDWRKHLPPESSPYVFWGNGLTLEGLTSFVKYLASETEIRNALIPVNYETLQRIEDYDAFGPYMYAQQYFKVENGNRLVWHISWIQHYVAEFAFLALILDYTAPDLFQAFTSPFLVKHPLHYSTVTNDYWRGDTDSIISNNADTYYTQYAEKFLIDADSSEVYERCITKRHGKCLTEVAETLKREGVNYRLVITPHYGKKRLHPSDIAFLRSVFGKDRVYDFSGKNDISADKRNFYDPLHFRPHVGAMIMDSIYGGGDEVVDTAQ
ncbi:MAG: hypothetical protein GF419_14090 [Ignavibacteriales bacterium]|nr:hypothetical protein [Ignavibacteriales bacterium]